MFCIVKKLGPRQFSINLSNKSFERFQIFFSFGRDDSAAFSSHCHGSRPLTCYSTFSDIRVDLFQCADFVVYQLTSH